MPFLENNGLELGGGDRVRIPNVAVPDRDDGGIFELDPGSAERLADVVKATINTHHGVALPSWIRFIGGLALERVNELADLCRADFDRLVGTLNPFEARHIGGLRWADVAGRIAL
ncbi:MAG: hypothetical protein P4L98_12155, partial [Ancalomicrobiaceae bacterium]|nr:hypothetical protein [Ancalomicrobiaceae bacterium]